MNQIQQNIFQQIQYLLGNLSEHIFQVNSFILEINNIINQSNLNFLILFDNFNFNMNFNPNFNHLNNQIIQKPKINAVFVMINIPNNHYDINEKLNLVLDNDITIREMLIIFLKKIGREDCLYEEKIGFECNGNAIKLNDNRKIKELFRNDKGIFSIIVHNIKNL